MADRKDIRRASSRKAADVGREEDPTETDEPVSAPRTGGGPPTIEGEDSSQTETTQLPAPIVRAVPQDLDKGLSKIAERLNGLHRAMQFDYLARAHEIGKELVRMKGVLSHGLYTAFLGRCGFSSSTAYNYVSVAENWAEIERAMRAATPAEFQRVGDFTLRRALRVVSELKKGAKPDTPAAGLADGRDSAGASSSDHSADATDAEEGTAGAADDAIARLREKVRDKDELTGDAALAREIRPMIDRLREIVGADGLQAPPTFAPIVVLLGLRDRIRLLTALLPEGEWRICVTCDGEGEKRRALCPSCNGRGYRFDSIENGLTPIKKFKSISRK